jgi:hypothetical protein
LLSDKFSFRHREQFWSTFSQQTVINISVFNSFSLGLILFLKIIELFENILNINFTLYHSFCPDLTAIRTQCTLLFFSSSRLTIEQNLTVLKRF